MPAKLYTLFPRKRKNSKSLYYCMFRRADGTRTSAVNTHQTNRAAAEAWAQNELAREGVQLSNNETTFRDFSRNFFAYGGDWHTGRARRGRIPTERYCMEITDLLEKHVIPFLGEKRIVAIDEDTLEEFCNTMYRRGYSGATINKAINIITTILEAARRKKIIKFVPPIERSVDAPKQKGILSIEEARAVFSVEWKCVRGYTASVLAAATAVRAGELQALIISDLHLSENYIHVHRSWDNRLQRLNATTKTKKPRNIFISNRVRQAIEDLLAVHPFPTPDAFLFWAEKNHEKPAEQAIFTRSLYQAMRQIGITEGERQRRNITFHSWRAWANSLMINDNIPLAKVQAMTGHDTRKMSEGRYYRLDDMRDVMDLQERIFTGEG